MVPIFKKRKTLLVIFLVLLGVGVALYSSYRKSVAEKNYVRGEELSRQRNYLEANMAFLKALEINSNSQRAPYARFLLASNYVAMTAYSQAITEYRKLIEEFPGHEKAADAQFMIGMVYKNAIGDNQKALDAFEKYRQNYPGGKSSAEVQSYLKRMRR